MKYVILSFDDGRRDTYLNAFPILKENDLTATLNVVSDFILHSEDYHCSDNFVDEIFGSFEWHNAIHAL